MTSRSAAALAFCVLCFGSSGVRADDPVIDGWGRVVNPDGDCAFTASDDSLTVTAPGPAHDLSTELGRMNAPRVLREVTGDFVVEVRVDGAFEPGEAGIAVRTPYNGAGLVVMADDDTYIRLERATLVGGGRKRAYANFEARVDGRIERFGKVWDFTVAEETPTWLRIERRGESISAAIAQSEGDWHWAAPKRIALPETVSVGVAVVNASTHPFGAKFDQMAVFVEQEAPRRADEGP